MKKKSFDIKSYRESMGRLLGENPKNEVFWRALDFALSAHETQWRKSGDPYIMHPCSVARILAEELDINNPEILAAALLHDTVEDVEEVTSTVLKDLFGANVEAIVDGCTKITHYTGDKQTFKKLVHRKIFSGAAANPEVMIVKLADRLHNLRTLSSMPRHKRQKIADETLDVYAPLATIFGLYEIKRELYDLALGYKFPRQGAKLQLHINRLREDPKVLALVNNLQKELREDGVDVEVLLRTKGLWGYYDIRNRILIKEIETPQEIMIVTECRTCCYQALGVLNRIHPPVPRTIRDFIANPKPSGYQGLHARANIEGRKFFFKIRTNEMTRHAHRGMVRDWSTDSKARGRFLRELQEMFDILGSDESVSYRDLIAASGRKELYTYTPNGDLICLPINSIVLDFAFRIHTAVGHKSMGALINNRRREVNTKLRDGDVVKIIKSDNKVKFPIDLQELCQTPKARSELSKAFRERRQGVITGIGLSILKQELLRYAIPFEVMEKEGMADILTYFRLSSLEELYLRLGEGGVRLKELLYEIRNGLFVGYDIRENTSEQLNKIELKTMDPVTVKSSACCRPSPLDKGVIGLLSERGLSLHRKECGQL
ncbi:MAG: HD domain-containing protein, partial [Desulfobulbaceae bacterium]|nr:HD domain-containing protein [Desulfobulbaceae bacterium]